MAMNLAAGTLLGFLTGLGLGGGSLLLLWLTAVMHLEPSAVRGINLLFFLPSAAIACCFRQRQGTLKLRSILPAMISGAIAAGVFSVLGAGFDPRLLKKGFGILLLVTGARELLYKPRQT